MSRFINRNVLFSVLTVALIAAMASPASAAGAGGGTAMPWEGPLQQIADSLAGPVARSLAIVAIVVFGIGLFFGAGGGAMRTVMSVGIGLSVVGAAVTWGLPLFGFGLSI